MAFVKLHDSILDSSLMEEDIHVRWVWVGMLSITDQDGIVRGTVNALARRLNVSIDQMEDALRVLMEPDPESTSDDEDGRRLVMDSPNRWRVVNYAFYRKLASYEDRKDYQREYQREWQRKRRTHNESNDVEQDVNNFEHVERIAEVEAEVEVEVDKNTCPPDDRFAEFWTTYPRKTAKKRAETAWRHLTATQRVVALASLPDHITYWKNTKRPTDKIPHAATWLNGEYWHDQLPAVEEATGKVKSAWANQFDAKGNPL